MNTNLNKKEKSAIAIYSIILLIYIMIFLVVPFSKNESSWISFAFTIVAILFSLLVSKIAFKDSKKSLSVLYAYPVFRIGFVYMLIQLVIGSVVSIIGCWYEVSYWIPLVVYMCLLGIVVILIILADNTRDMVEDIGVKTLKDTCKFDTIKMEMDIIEKTCAADLLESELRELAREIRFSDPVSSDMTKNLEESIQDEVRKLKDIVISQDKAGIKEKSVYIRNLVIERNNVCLHSKNKSYNND